MYSGGQKDNRDFDGKADGVKRFGRQQSGMRYGECCGHHRGLRPGHVLKGVARELGRSVCGLARKGKVSGADSEE